jgi:hypothetical protein
MNTKIGNLRGTTGEEITYINIGVEVGAEADLSPPPCYSHSSSWLWSVSRARPPASRSKSTSSGRSVHQITHFEFYCEYYFAVKDMLS